MALWELIGILGLIFLIIEMFTPSMFFLNFAIASFITAIVSLKIPDYQILVVVFVAMSFISFWFLRPILIKRFCKNNETGIESKYIGKNAVAETDITTSSGVLSIYGERWEARSESDEIINAGSEVKILRNESIIMYVEKYKGGM
ncbi:MAG: NfeD family protein [bacterium]|nr:NfeD family protein [bacterium]